MGWDKQRIKVSFGGLEYGVIPYEALDIIFQDMFWV